TDVLSEGLNLQDATRMINYDLHWNPVRLMQRIGRVDRRLNPEIEDKIISDHPDQADLRGKIAYWNFLPPEELEDLLKLYRKVSHKTLKISKTFGIEGKKLLTPEDDYDALKEFNNNLEGEKTSVEKMRLELTQLLKDDPELEDHLNSMPLKIFSGKEHPSDGTKAVFFCYAHPALDTEKVKQGITDADAWTEDAGVTKWYLYDIESEKISINPSEIIEIIRSMPLTPRKCEIERPTLTEIRKKIEKHIKNDYFKKVQAPVGVKATLKAWMELN
ncbi:helicase, partial [bacterium]|nr:helicase [bacterium]MBU1025486.1 helicase [bacterium]